METNRINDIVKKLYPKDLKSTPGKRKLFSKFEDNWPLLAITMCIVMVPMLASVYYYNKFVVFYTDAITAEAQVKAYLQKRGNIVTNLTKMVVDYAEHEKTMYKYMADIRKDLISKSDTLLSAASAIDVTKIDSTEFTDFQGLLSKFMAWSENYPDLKLNQNFQDFMKEIVAVEGNIASQRIDYNNKVNTYTTYRMKFPNRIFALMFNFKAMQFYEGVPEAQAFKEVEY